MNGYRIILRLKDTNPPLPARVAWLLDTFCRLTGRAWWVSHVDGRAHLHFARLSR